MTCKMKKHTLPLKTNNELKEFNNVILPNNAEFCTCDTSQKAQTEVDIQIIACILCFENEGYFDINLI